MSEAIRERERREGGSQRYAVFCASKSNARAFIKHRVTRFMSASNTALIHYANGVIKDKLYLFNLPQNNS